MIDPTKYPKLKLGGLYVFQFGDRRERGRLLYAMNRKANFVDGNGKHKFSKIVAHRTGYEPEPKRGSVISVHLEAGRFAIHEC